MANGTQTKVLTGALVAIAVGVGGYVANAAIDAKGAADKSYVDERTESVRQEHRQDLIQHKAERAERDREYREDRKSNQEVQRRMMSKIDRIGERVVGRRWNGGSH